MNSKGNNMTKNTRSLDIGKRLFHSALCGLAAGAFGWSPPALGVSANINIVNFAFSPNAATISVNDTVTWTWVGSPHTTTSDTGLWDSGVFGPGHSFTRTFASAGTFPFHCTVHPFMTGTITVQSVNAPPTVAFTNPPKNSVLAAPASFTLSANASDSDGNVANVEFLQGGSVLGNITTAPYSVSVRDLPAGSYAFSAVATDNGGNRATNTLTISVVTPGPIVLSAPKSLPSAAFQFNYSATLGLRYVIQRSPDMTRWTTLSTNTAAAGSMVFTDQNAGGNPGFYRVGLLPNP
jgi:plastocyanin